MKLIFLFLSLAFHKLTFSQDSIFGTYELKSSFPDYMLNGTILKLNCDYTYTCSDSIAKQWGTWKVKENESLILSIDTLQANGKTERSKAKVYYIIINGQFRLDEREYSKKAFKKDIKGGNEAMKANNIPFRSHYSEEGYEKNRKRTMSLYYEKKQSLICH